MYGVGGWVGGRLHVLVLAVHLPSADHASVSTATHHLPPLTSHHRPRPLQQVTAGRRRRELTSRCLYTKPITPVAGQPVDIFYNPGGCFCLGFAVSSEGCAAFECSHRTFTVPALLQAVFVQPSGSQHSRAR